MHFQGSITRKPYNVRGPNFVHIIIRVVNVLTKFHGNLRGIFSHAPRAGRVLASFPGRLCEMAWAPLLTHARLFP